jgi:hypothetical protein
VPKRASLRPNYYSLTIATTTGFCPPAAAHAMDFVGLDGHAFAAYDAKPGTRVMVRPDGYVGG